MRALAALMLLAACATAPAQVPSPVSFRDPSAVIGSQTGVAADDLTGDWTVRSSFLQSGVGFGGEATIAATGPDLTVTHLGFVCSDQGECLGDEVRTVYRADGPGRWRRADDQPAGIGQSGTPGAIWVFWIDGDRRTMAIGDRTGTFAHILDRAPEGGADRIAAAREVLAWYGFDVERMASN